MKREHTSRLLAALLSVLLVLSLAGCRNADRTDASGKKGAVQTETVVDRSAGKEDAGSAGETTKKKTSETEETDKANGKEDASKADADKSGTSTRTSKTTSKKKSVSSPTTKKTTAKPAPKAPQRRSLIGDALELTGDVQRMLIGTVDFGSGGIIYQNPKDAAVSVRVRTKRNADGGIQLYLVVKNKTGRPIRLNGYSNFAIRDLLGNELLSTDISLNKPVVLNDQDEQLISVILPREWYGIDELYQLSVEAGLFNSVIALDYDFL